MNVVVLLLAVLAAFLADYLAYHHQTALYIALGFSATIVALVLLFDGIGAYRTTGRTV